MFIDKVKLNLKAGDGGDGLVAFRREKYVPLGGPAGGDGGDGGSIIFVVDTNKSTLLDLRYTKFIRAKDGEKGKTKRMHGESAEDVLIKVPLGTTVRDLKSGELIADLCEKDERAIICKGGKGGLGNYHFASGRNSAPEYAKMGQMGEEKMVEIELKLLADVGLVGFPSVGKSTFLNMVSKARPEIADYHFTTLRPYLGLVSNPDGFSFVMADLPGLIEGASQGRGLGHEFLRHIERCRVIVHVLDMGAEDGRDPLEDFKIINHELSSYDSELLKRPMVIVANKMDLEKAEDNLKRFKKAYPDIKVFETMTMANEGLQEVLYYVEELLKKTPSFALKNEEKKEIAHYTLSKKDDEFRIINEGGHNWRVEGEKIKRIFENADLRSEEGIYRFSRVLKNMKVDEKLREAGCLDGDSVYIEDYGFIFEEEE